MSPAALGRDPAVVIATGLPSPLLRWRPQSRDGRDCAHVVGPDMWYKALIGASEYLSQPGPASLSLSLCVCVCVCVCLQEVSDVSETSHQGAR